MLYLPLSACFTHEDQNAGFACEALQNAPIEIFYLIIIPPFNLGRCLTLQTMAAFDTKIEEIATAAVPATEVKAVEGAVVKMAEVAEVKVAEGAEAAAKKEEVSKDPGVNDEKSEKEQEKEETDKEEKVEKEAEEKKEREKKKYKTDTLLLLAFR